MLKAPGQNGGNVFQLDVVARNDLSKTLTQHEDLDAVWYFVTVEGSYW